MPAALDVDREQVRMLAVSVGVREAARQLGLEEDTVCQWAKRGEWLKNIPRSRPMPPTVLRPVSIVSTPAEIQVQRMRENAMAGRDFALEATAKALGHMVKLSPEQLCEKDAAQTLHTHVKSASIAGGYGAQTSVHITALAYGERGATEPDTDLVADVHPESVEVQGMDTLDVPRAEVGHSASCEPPDPGVST